MVGGTFCAIKLFGKRVDKMIVYKSLAVTFLAFLLVVITTATLLVTESSSSEIDSLFESTSAFATVGLTVGISAEAHFLGKLMLIITMFLGRVGPVSFALSISMAAAPREKKQVMPEARLWVG